MNILIRKPGKPKKFFILFYISIYLLLKIFDRIFDRE